MKNRIENDIELIQSPVNDIIGRLPSWPVRLGASVIAGIIVSAFIASVFIRYPETVTGHITITSENPPSEIAVRYSSEIDSIFIQEGNLIREGEPILVLKNTAQYRDIMKAKAFISDVSRMTVESMCDEIFLSEQLLLGELSQFWGRLVSSCLEYKNFKALDYYGRNAKITVKESENKGRYTQMLREKEKIIEEDLSLQSLSMMRDSIMAGEGYISRQEYEEAQQRYISKQSAKLNSQSELALAALTQEELMNQAARYGLQGEKEKAGLEVAIRDAVESLAGQISSWEEQYVVKASRNGKVAYAGIWNRGQHVSQGQIVATVIPEDTGTTFGRVMVPTGRFGKVSEGQRVNVKLNGFPYTEFGILKGKVSAIGKIPRLSQDGSMYYDVVVKFGDGKLSTTYGINIPNMPELDGIADIEVDNLRLIHHIITPLKSLFNNNLK